MAEKIKKNKKDLIEKPRLERALPYDNNAEVAILSSMFIDPTHTLDFAMKLPEESFFSERHKIIFGSLLRLNEKKIPIDFITFVDYLQKEGYLEKAGGEEYILQIMQAMPTAANVENYCKIVDENFTLRRLIIASSNIVDKAFSKTSDVSELIDSIQQEVLSITSSQNKTDYIKIEKVVKEVVAYYQDLIKGIDNSGVDTGISQLTKIIGGFKKQAMIVLAARTSIGKTAMALNFTANIAIGATKKSPVGIFSLEMSSKELAQRLLIIESRLGVEDIISMESNKIVSQRFFAAATRLKDAPIYIDDTPSIDIMELRSKARRMKADHQIELLIIDYLQLITVAGSSSLSSREQEVAKISGAIKAIAKELDIPVIVLAQLNRQAEQSGQQPKLQHLRESGSIEQDADVVMILSRDRSKQYEEGQPKSLETDIMIMKNRAGALGIAKVNFIPQMMRFEEISRIDEDEDVPRDQP